MPGTSPFQPMEDIFSELSLDSLVSGMDSEVEDKPFSPMVPRSEFAFTPSPPPRRAHHRRGRSDPEALRRFAALSPPDSPAAGGGLLLPAAEAPDTDMLNKFVADLDSCMGGLGEDVGGGEFALFDAEEGAGAAGEGADGEPTEASRMSAVAVADEHGSGGKRKRGHHRRARSDPGALFSSFCVGGALPLPDLDIPGPGLDDESDMSEDERGGAGRARPRPARAAVAAAAASSKSAGAQCDLAVTRAGLAPPAYHRTITVSRRLSISDPVHPLPLQPAVLPVHVPYAYAPPPQAVFAASATTFGPGYVLPVAPLAEAQRTALPFGAPRAQPLPLPAIALEPAAL